MTDLDLVVSLRKNERYRTLWDTRPDYRETIAALARKYRGEPEPSKTRADGIIPQVVVAGHVATWTGYGRIGLWVGRSLEALGIPVGFYGSLNAPPGFLSDDQFVIDRVVQRVPDSAVVVDMGILPWWQNGTESLNRTVVFTMHESSTITEATVSRLNQARAVVVPCEFNARTFKACGVTNTIHVVPLGVDPAEGYTPKPWREGQPLTFGMAGRLWHGGCRKGINEGATAFLKAFPTEDVRLRIKVFPDCLQYLAIPSDPRIEVNTEPMSPPVMAEWCGSCDVGLIPSKGEGFGLHSVEMMACERPIIAAMQTGTAQFFTPDCGWILDGEWQQAEQVYVGWGEWFVPSEASMIAAMRAAYADPGEVRRRGANAAKRAAEFTWGRMGEGLRNVLAGLGLLPQPPTSPHQPTPVHTNGHALDPCPHRHPIAGCSCWHCGLLVTRVTREVCLDCDLRPATP